MNERGSKIFVTLKGGPFDGARVKVHWGEGFQGRCGALPKGMAASYRPSRIDRTYTFKGLVKSLTPVTASAA